MHTANLNKLGKMLYAAASVCNKFWNVALLHFASWLWYFSANFAISVYTSSIWSAFPIAILFSVITYFKAMSVFFSISWSTISTS